MFRELGLEKFISHSYFLRKHLEDVSCQNERKGDKPEKHSTEEWQREVPERPLWLQPRGSHQCRLEQDDGAPASGRRPPRKTMELRGWLMRGPD